MPDEPENTLSAHDIRRRLSRVVIAIFVIAVLSLAAFAGIASFIAVRKVAMNHKCSANMMAISHEITIWSKANGDRYPDPNSWCDILTASSKLTPQVLRCPFDKTGPSSYALNPDATPSSPGDVVLLFESKSGWNLHGGPELLDNSRHKKRDHSEYRIRGCKVGLVDGSIQFIRQDELPNLRWTKEQNPPK